VDNADLIEKTVLVSLPIERRPTEEEILAAATKHRIIYPVDDQVFERIIKRLHARLAITMDLGTALEDEHTPWLAGRKADISPVYWERYRTWLERQRWPIFVTNGLNGVSDEILDLMGDPQRAGHWARRGLVVGDVQSGKTATYTAVANKAADAGYKLIILLTGTLESLRRQTQERLDEGLVGFDSSELLQQPQVRTNRAVGVGIVDPKHSVGVFTSRERDFSRQLMTQLGFQLDSFTQPVLVVIKKNKRVLGNLEAWLRGYNAGADGKISAPLLLIDDEADSASINTNTEGADPTAINKGVRALLSLFHRSCYVGVTATPFANVFIDPDSDGAMLGDDLFPRDFIYSLEPPTNYVGPQSVFAGSSIDDPPPFIRWIEDADAFFPPTQKAADQVEAIPESLYEAVRTFIVSTTLRDLRGEGPTHRSMLVNVSRFTNIQNQVTSLIYSFVLDLQRDVRNYSKLSTNEALEIPSIAGLERTWRTLATPDGPGWPEVQEALNSAIQPIQVRAVNQGTGAASLDYKPYKDQGLRVIAVGGNSLSRGLTLEGLSTSYFYRNSQMYDTLLQMGRWFGYRDGYNDLCRLWLGEEAFSWYSHIAGASEELRLEFKRMKRLGLTPQAFGLKVRAHPDSLIVTARNKMRTAKTVIRNVSLSGQGIETARLRTSSLVIDANAEAVSRFVKSLGAPSEVSRGGSGPILWRDVPARAVSQCLADFTTHPLNYDFQADKLAAYLEQTEHPCLQYWDVSLPSGTLDVETFGGMKVHPYRRHVVVNKANGSLLVSGSSARVGSRGDERAGLSESQIRLAESNSGGKNTSDGAYRAQRTRPLLLVHVFRGFTKGEGEEKATVPFEPTRSPLVALGLSFPPFPTFDDSDVRERVEYKVNLVEWRSLFEHEVDDESIEDDDFD
jgi:hypothetical protein